MPRNRRLQVLDSGLAPNLPIEGAANLPLALKAEGHRLVKCDLGLELTRAHASFPSGGFQRRSGAMIGKVATGPMRVSVSMKQPSDPRVSVHKGISPPMQHRNVVVATPDGRMSPNRSGVVIPARPAQGVPMPTSPPRGASSPQLASRPGVASPRSMQSPASVASARVAYTPAPRPSVTSSQARVGPSPKASSPSKLQKPSSVAAPPTKALHGNAHGLVVAGGQQRAMTMTATIRGEKEAEKPKVEAKPEAKPAPESGRHKHLLATMSLKPHSTAQGSHRLQTRRKDGNKTPEVEQFLMDSLRRDPGSSQAQLSEADLAAIVSVMEFYEFEPDASDDEDSGGMGVGGASGYIFVVDSGSFEVRIDGTPIATLGRGCTFGWNFLMKQPQASSVFACTKSGLWGADGQKVQTMLHERQRDRLQQNRKLLDCVSMFKGLPPRQIELLSSAIVSETVPAGMKVVEKGELSTALYFIKQGTLLVEENQKELGPGEFFGERALLHHAPRSATVSAVTEAELLRLEAENLKSVVGNDVMVYLSRSLILESLKGSHACGQFSATQQSAILQKMTISEVPANMPIREAKSDKFLLLAVIQGEVHDITRLGEPQVFLPGTPYESKAKEVDKVSSPQSVTMCRVNTEVVREKLVLAAGPEGAKVAVLMESGLEAALADGSPSSDPSVTSRKERFGQKMLAVKKVPIFRHLNKQQTERVVMSLQDQKLVHSEVVIRQGDKGNHFFVIVKGEVTVTIDGKKIRTQGKNASFGERALLFDEPRSATVQVSSEAAELWTLEKSVFKQIITEKMKKDLEYRISIQDAGVGLSDLKPLSFLGAGAFSTVRLVAAKKAGVPYMLPTLSSYTLDEMLEARSPDQQVFSQLYVNPERSRSEEYVAKLEAAGVKALFVTVDAPQLGRREKDMRNKFTQQGSDVQGDEEDDGGVDRSQGATRAISSYIDPGLNWEDVPWLKSITKMKVLLKGVQCAEDGVDAFKAGLAGCVLSNHGGRQLDTARSGIEVLPEVMAALKEAGATKETFSVFIDGGVRRGGDIFKAVALGAQAVGVGRPVLYSLAAYGQNGIVRMVHMLQDELMMVMRLSGTPDIKSITEKHVITTNLADHIVPLPMDFLTARTYQGLEPAAKL
ncbi:unnamed protein product [Effrenium voratum]|nr:unnamed protein product [Effrenium voratum]